MKPKKRVVGTYFSEMEIDALTRRAAQITVETGKRMTRNQLVRLYVQRGLIGDGWSIVWKEG